jgi:hypothetical protein
MGNSVKSNTANFILTAFLHSLQLFRRLILQPKQSFTARAACKEADKYKMLAA